LPAEVIVVDDGSADDTAAIASAHGTQVIRHPKNFGFAGLARNTGLHASSGEWVAFLDSDDEWLPDHLDHLWELRGGHALVGSSSLRCGSSPTDDRFHGSVARKPVVLHSPDRLISTHNLFTMSGCMVRRDIALELGGFHTKWGVEDLDLWVRLLERWSAICSPRVTVIYHRHDDNLSSDGRRMLLAHTEVAHAWRTRTGAASVALDRWQGVKEWDGMRLSLRVGQRRAALRSALAILARPRRIIGALILLRERFLGRRMSARIGRDGGPSVALLVTAEAERHAVIDSLRGRTIRDFSGASVTRGMLTLLRRPAGLAVVGSRSHAVLLRALGTHTVTAHRVLEDR
jgi:GT2 family glycosyltransferase